MVGTNPNIAEKPQEIRDIIITCKVCHFEVKFDEAAVTRKVSTELREMGLLCPKCKTFFHSNFISLELEQTLKRINDRVNLHRVSPTNNSFQAIKSMQKTYKKQFDELNVRLRKKYKLVVGEPSVKSWEE